MSHYHQPLQQKIALWNAIDKKLKYIQEKTKEMKETRSQLTVEIIENLKSFPRPPTLTLEEGKEEIVIVEKKEASGLTFTYIENCLGEILEEEEQVEFIMNYLREQRTYKTTKELKRVLVKR